jgi:hypothetical protein
MADIHFTPVFHHDHWADNIDLVQADGPRGFNVRFDAIEGDLKNLSTVVGAVDAELDRLSPTGVQHLNLPPSLVPGIPGVGDEPWTVGTQGQVFVAGPRVFGLMNLILPNGVRLLSLRAFGFTRGNLISFVIVRTDMFDPGVRNLVEFQVSSPATSGTTSYDHTEPIVSDLALVDTERFRYTLSAFAPAVATLGNATAGIAGFQIAYTAA